MKRSLFNTFMNKVQNAGANDVIWKAGFYFINLTSKQAETLRLATLDKWGDNDGVVRYPNGISIKPIKK